MRIEIQREVFNANNTIGRMFVDGAFFGYTLEDKDRSLTDKMSVTEIKLRKIFGQTAIPYGEYEVILSYSNRFKKVMPLLLNVKGFEGVRIHGGNTEANTLGCPLLGAKKTDKSIFECAAVNKELIEKLEHALKFNKAFVSITKGISRLKNFMATYTSEIKEYLKVRYESQKNITHLAAELKGKFDLESNVETIRRNISSILQKQQLTKKKQDTKRLYFDIETSYYLVPTFQFWKVNINPDNIIREKKIICIAYKWEYEDSVHVLVWDKNQDDTKLVKDFIQVIKQADEIVAHNGDKFDIKELRTRAILTDNLMFPVYRTLDTLKKAKQYFRFPSNKLDYLGKVLNGEGKLKTEGMKMWIDICEHKDKEALTKMVEYCKRDVIVLEDVYKAISPYIYHNTNFAVLKGKDRWQCPECASDNVKLSHTDATAMGIIRRHMKCNDCRKFFKLSNRSYLFMLDKLILKSRGLA